jgi:excisionase family DNA binding protein
MMSTAEAARRAGISKNTVLRWIQEGHVPDVTRDWRGWRIWSEADIARLTAFKADCHGRNLAKVGGSGTPRAQYAKPAAESLARWDRAWGQGSRAVSR